MLLKAVVRNVGILLMYCLPCMAQTRRAVIVGNDNYLTPTTSAPPSIQTLARLKQIDGKPSRAGLSRLSGAYNDALEIEKVLMARFNFEENNIVMLPGIDRPATADNILGAIRSHLIKGAAPGDISVFYYAGHGSRIRNTSTENASGLDSTIIPADALRGVPDIRGKELARLYVEAAQNQVHLTVIQDSCFSGAAARGLFTAGRSRDEDPDNNVSVNESWTGPLPEELGVLAMMASEDYQPAMEIPVDEFGGGHHGAFTWALLRALYSSPANEPAERLFQRTRALLQSRVANQEPVLFAKNGRGQLDLFGQPADTSVRAHSIAVAKVDPKVNAITLNGGQGMNLYQDCILKRISPASPTVTIRITATPGLTLSKAAIETGKITDVNVGDLFQLERWVVPRQAALRLFVGPPMPLSDLREAAAALAPLTSEPSIHWVADPTIETPTHLLTWDGQWHLVENRRDAAGLVIEKANPATVLKSLANATGVRLYVRFPLPQEIATNLDIGPSSHNPAIELTDRTEDARYLLQSRVETNGEIRYAWTLPGLTEQDLANQAEQARREKKRAPILAQPLRSYWAQTADSLTQNALKFARVIGWLELEAPPAQEPFPFHLSLKDVDSGKTAVDELIGGHRYSLLLDPNNAAPAEVAPRWVYVFEIDSTGCGSLLAPQSGANHDNRFPRSPPSAHLTSNQADIIVLPAYGTDMYIMLASGSTIDAPGMVFNFDGVQSRGVGTNPLDRLFSQDGAGTRGPKAPVPTDWSIERLTFYSVPPDTPEASAAVKDAMSGNLSSCPPPGK
jgi:hypothetical protein